MISTAVSDNAPIFSARSVSACTRVRFRALRFARAETYPCASSRVNASRGKDRRVIGLKPSNYMLFCEQMSVLWFVNVLQTWFCEWLNSSAQSFIPRHTGQLYPVPRLIPRLHLIHVVSTCIPCRRLHCILHRRQNCRHGYMYPLVCARRTLLRTCIRRHVDGYKLLVRDTCIRLYMMCPVWTHAAWQRLSAQQSRRLTGLRYLYVRCVCSASRSATWSSHCTTHTHTHTDTYKHMDSHANDMLYIINTTLKLYKTLNGCCSLLNNET